VATEVSNIHPRDWEQLAYQSMLKGDYPQAASFYEQAIEAEPNIQSYYWYLGLIRLLQQQEAEAQTIWLWAMAKGDAEQIDIWTVELLQVLQTEARRRQTLADYPVAWAIRQHIREINPRDINNLLQIVQLAIHLEKFTGEDLTSLGLIATLGTELDEAVNPNLLLDVLEQTLDCDPLHPQVLEFAKVCLPRIQEEVSALARTLIKAAIKIDKTQLQPSLAASFAELCVHLDNQNPQVFHHLAIFYQNAGKYSQGIESAKQSYSRAQTLLEQIFANYLVMRSLMVAAGHWEEAVRVFQQQELLLRSYLNGHDTPSDELTTIRLLGSTFFAPYFQDKPQQNRQLQNQVAQLCQISPPINKKKQFKGKQQTFATSKIYQATKPLKIGYLSHCLGRHSVGWLARWLFLYHDQQQFEIYGYFIKDKQITDDLQNWYTNQTSKFYQLELNAAEIAAQIYEDEINILIDLDSITLSTTCEVMALKPAPVQVTWLGWDASGIPTIDYFIADSYVLPESAQAYYTETIWRLPNTYIAVDGFEVGVPTLRREQLDIPSDAVVYMSAQKGYKRHPKTVRLQMQIVKEVPNSYFLIKGIAEQESVKNLFIQIAEETGVDSNRLRFLSLDISEEVHRANLGIADVILDTYPYNGATTTLETLWMGIPLVTRVGQQFAARNSYTMMMNAGVTEGIAWTDEEYVEWGVRLGKDETLRQQISWKLQQSRQNAPLWNAKQFTREMEKAYKQMWTKYIENNDNNNS